jgi:3D (Asp-Asp-Asp) domain-containing protein
VSTLQRLSARTEPPRPVTAAIGDDDGTTLSDGVVTTVLAVWFRTGRTFAARPRETRVRAAAGALFIAAASTLGAGALSEDPLPDVTDSRTAAIFQPLAPPDPEVQIHRVTAYCSCPLCCGRWSDGVTASGRHAVQGRTAAADPSVWGIGTCLDVPGVGRREVEDTGAAMVGRRLDIYFESHEEALLFGVRLLLLRKC